MAVTLNGSALSKPAPKVKLTRKSSGGNGAGAVSRRKIIKALCALPNLTLKELAVMVPDMDWASLRYHVARGLKLGHLVMQGKARSCGKETPRYSAAPDQVQFYLHKT